VVGLTWPLPELFDDGELERRLFTAPGEAQAERPAPACGGKRDKPWSCGSGRAARVDGDSYPPANNGRPFFRWSHFLVLVVPLKRAGDCYCFALKKARLVLDIPCRLQAWVACNVAVLFPFSGHSLNSGRLRRGIS
jgi:hypothetical protein